MSSIAVRDGRFAISQHDDPNRKLPAAAYKFAYNIGHVKLRARITPNLPYRNTVINAISWAGLA